MKASITGHGKTATIETEYDDIPIDELYDTVINPLVIAYGYHPDSVKDMMREI